MNIKGTELPIYVTTGNDVALWEEGGCTGKSGFAVIVANNNGTKKKPVFIKETGNLSNGKHALLKVGTSDIVALANYVSHNETFLITLYRISQINRDSKTAVLSEFLQIRNEKVSNEAFMKQYFEVVEAAKRKSSTVYCKSPTYIAD